MTASQCRFEVLYMLAPSALPGLEVNRNLTERERCAQTVLTALQRRSEGFRVLALSATPGSEMARVQNVVSKLRISHMEVRDESDPDVKDFMHAKMLKVRTVISAHQRTSIPNSCKLAAVVIRPFRRQLSAVS